MAGGVAYGNVGYGPSIAGSLAGVASGSILKNVAGAFAAAVAGTDYATPASVGNRLAKYIIQTADATLPNAQVLGDLATGLVKVTTTTGVLSAAAAGTDYTGPIAGLAANRIPFGTSGTAVGASGDLTFDDAQDQLLVQGSTSPAVFVTCSGSTSSSIMRLRGLGNRDLTLRAWGNTGSGTTATISNNQLATVLAENGSGLVVGTSAGASNLYLITNDAVRWQIDGSVGRIGQGAAPSSSYGYYLESATGTLSHIAVKNTTAANGEGAFSAINNANTGLFVASFGNASTGNTLGGALAKAGAAIIMCSSTTGFAVGTNVASPFVVATGNVEVLRYRGDHTLASGTSVAWDMTDHVGLTLTLTGSTNNTLATGMNRHVFRAPTITAASAMTIDHAATVAIAGAPTGTGAGPATLANAYALWVQSGLARFDGNARIDGLLGMGKAAQANFPIDVLGTASSWQARIKTTSTTGLCGWQAENNGGNTVNVQIRGGSAASTWLGVTAAGQASLWSNDHLVVGTFNNVPVYVAANQLEQARFDPTIADGETALLIRRNVGGTQTVQRVSMGAADSGGTNFKLLRVAN